MCLILFAHKAHRDYQLILAANRDEAYARPSTPAAFWQDHREIYGGRDLEQGGTWLGLTLGGRIAAVTNFRSDHGGGNAALSRGLLVSGYLTDRSDAESFLERTQQQAVQYRGFIVIAGNPDALFWYSNRGPGVRRVLPGVHGLSNHLLDTPWPKIVRSKQALNSLLRASEDALVTGLFDILGDRSEAADHELPDTGVGLVRERRLSANFVSNEHYGTRASTVVLIDTAGETLFIERRYGPGGSALGESSQRFALSRPPSAGAAGQSPSGAEARF